MHAPTIGEIVARQLTGAALPFEASTLDPDRFQGAVQAEPYAF